MIHFGCSCFGPCAGKGRPVDRRGFRPPIFVVSLQPAGCARRALGRGGLWQAAAQRRLLRRALAGVDDAVDASPLRLNAWVSCATAARCGRLRSRLRASSVSLMATKDPASSSVSAASMDTMPERVFLDTRSGCARGAMMAMLRCFRQAARRLRQGSRRFLLQVGSAQ